MPTSTTPAPARKLRSSPVKGSVVFVTTACVVAGVVAGFGVDGGVGVRDGDRHDFLHLLALVVVDRLGRAIACGESRRREHDGQGNDGCKEC